MVCIPSASRHSTPKRTRSIKNAGAGIVVIITVFSGVVFLLSKYTSSGDMIPNQLLPIVLIEDHSFALNRFVTPPSNPSEKAVADRNGGLAQYYFRQGKDGAVVSLFPVLPGILNVPVYVVASAFGVNLKNNALALSHWTSAIIAALSVGVMYLLLKKIFKEERLAVFFSLVYAFATCVWGVAATGLWQHGPSLLFLNLAILLLLEEDDRTASLSGFFFALNVVNRPTNVLFMLASMAYIFWHRRTVLWRYLAYSVVPFALLVLYFMAYWGSLFGPMQSVASGALLTKEMAPGVVLTKVMMWLISPSRGLLSFSPLFIFSFFAMWDVCISKDRSWTSFKYLCLAVPPYLVLLSLVRGVGGWTFGYRYMIELIPLLVILLALYWKEEIRPRPWGFLAMSFYAMLVFSVYVQVLGAFVYPCGFNSSPKSITETPERVWSFTDSELTRCTEKMFR